ncbi:MAG: hypothetical protein QOJ98_723 [Acidobacteriota bacterium]|jgi:hypothetical protein|nr:hypothetical protein [Acidobacteriota bacterium]
MPREIFYTGALLALAGIAGVFVGLARAYGDMPEPGARVWLMAIAAIVWLIAGGIGLLRLQRWAALLLSIPAAILGLWMLNVASVFFLLPLAVTIAGWRTLR